MREAAEPFVSKLFPHSTKLLRTRPLEAMVVGAFVRGLSMRDVESLCEEAGLGKLSKSTASRICAELRERFEAFKRRDLYQVRLVALFLDAIFLNVIPKGPKEGVLCAWGFTDEGRAVSARGLPGDARVPRGLARVGPRPDRPRPAGADADRRRRRPRPDQGGRAVLAGLGPPASCARSPGRAILLATKRQVPGRGVGVRRHLVGENVGWLRPRGARGPPLSRVDGIVLRRGSHRDRFG